MPARAPRSLAPRKRPTQARSQDRVRRILEAARELVESGPLEDVTTTAIARRAGLPVGSLYQYFPNRLSVLAELADRELREIDAASVAALEASASLAWEAAVDLVVDGTLAAHAGRDRSASLFRTLHPAPEFREIAARSNERLAAALAKHPALGALGLAPEAVERVARVAIEAGDGVQQLVLSAGSEEQAAALCDEMKKLLKAYLGLYLKPSATPAGESATHLSVPREERT